MAPDALDVLTVVEEFQKALNAADSDELKKLAAEDIVLAGASTEGAGRALLEPWLIKPGVSWTPLRWFYRGDRHVVVEQIARWRPKRLTRGPIRSQERLATVFVVTDGRITRCERFTDVAAALGATGLTLQNEVPAPPPLL